VSAAANQTAADLAIAWSGLIEAFDVTPDGWVSALEISIWTAMPVTQLVNLGWIQPISRGRGPVYAPAGALRDALQNGGHMPTTTTAAPAPRTSPTVPPKTPPRERASSAPSAEALALNTPAPVTALTGADTLITLGQMREALGILSDEILNGLDRIATAEKAAGWANLEHVSHETVGMLRLSMDLQSALQKYQMVLSMAELNAIMNPTPHKK